MFTEASQESDDREKGSPPLSYAAVEEAPDTVIANRFGVFGPFLSKLFNNGVEARGIERVPENQRETKNILNRYVPRSL